MDALYSTWPWYVVGPLITIIMAMLILVGKKFGISTSLETFCKLGGAGKRIPYFDQSWRADSWLLAFIIGAIIGGAVAADYLPNPNPVDISANTIRDLQAMGIAYVPMLAPPDVFSFEALQSTAGIVLMVVGGFLVGFGTRYAGGCTSGHAISGLSNLQWPSLLATLGFFAGGLFSTYILLPLIF